MGRQIGAEAIPHPLRVAPVGDETDRFQRRHVPAHARLARAKRRHQFADAMLAAIPENAKRGEAGRLSERGEQGDRMFHAAAVCGKTHMRHAA